MAEVLMLYADLTAPDGTAYLPRACGRMAEDGLWEGWIEFVPARGGTTLRSGRETVQPNRDDLLYWASGLTPVYLEGALERALEPPRPPAPAVPPEPTYERPKPPRGEAAAPNYPPPHPVLDPFHVYAQGEDVLRQELTALDAARLRDIIAANALVDPDALDLEEMSAAALAELVVAAVRKRAHRGR